MSTAYDLYSRVSQTTYPSGFAVKNSEGKEHRWGQTRLIDSTGQGQGSAGTGVGDKQESFTVENRWGQMIDSN